MKAVILSAALVASAFAVDHPRPSRSKSFAKTSTQAPPYSSSSSCSASVVTVTVTAPSSPSSTAPSSSGRVKFGGINISGFDFGCDTNGTCLLNQTGTFLAQTGPPQIDHFVHDDKLNAFRLPVGWQYLLNNVLGGPLNAANFATYNTLVQGCLSSGAQMCIVDIHNYARWDGLIIGQSPGGPTNAQFANVWSQLATAYANESRIAFGIMNEPHDIPDIITWAGSVQAAVTAIRSAGATSQYILMPGNNYTSAMAFVENGSGPALLNVTNPASSGLTGYENLIFDVHKYLDYDNSGTHTECVTNNINDTFVPLAAWLRGVGRMAMLTETGGGNTASCEVDLCQELAFLDANSDVYLGFTTWAAGGFDQTYNLTETPILNGTVWYDQPLVKDCIIPNGPNA